MPAVHSSEDENWDREVLCKSSFRFPLFMLVSTELYMVAKRHIDYPLWALHTY